VADIEGDVELGGLFKKTVVAAGLGVELLLDAVGCASEAGKVEMALNDPLEARLARRLDTCAESRVRVSDERVTVLTLLLLVEELTEELEGGVGGKSAGGGVPHWEDDVEFEVVFEMGNGTVVLTLVELTPPVVPAA
jgi:hypothetical protein